MSSYQVSNKVIDQVVAVMTAAEFPSVEYQVSNKLGQRLAEMNDRAVCFNRGAPPGKVIYDYHHWYVSYYSLMTDRAVMCQALKTLKCFLYQCSEGKVPEEPLFKRVEEFANVLQYRIIEQLPEYDSAIWGAAPRAV